jgi:hypothetical protein
MAYIYLLDIYKLIDQRVADARDAIAHMSGDRIEKKFQEGRITVLMNFQDYLTTHLNPKLPRRLRESMQTKAE